MTKKTFEQELEEIRIQERAEIEKILQDPNISPELRQLIAETNTEPYTKPTISTEQMEENDFEISDPTAIIDEEIDRAESTKKEIDSAFDILSRQQKAVIFGFMNGKTQQEIADELGIPQQNVSQYYKIALKKLQQNPLLFDLYDRNLDRKYASVGPIEQKEILPRGAQVSEPKWKLRKHE